MSIPLGRSFASALGRSTSNLAILDKRSNGCYAAAAQSLREAELVPTWGQPSVARSTLEWPEIYERLQSDREDFEAHSALTSRVHGIARAALRQYGWQLVEDVVADTCSAVVMSLQKARGADTFKGFVIGIYLNTRRFYLDHWSASGTLEAIDLPAAAEPRPDHDALALLQECVGELPPRERTAILLRFFEDAPYSRIAEALKVTQNNARQIVHVAKARLTECARRVWPRGRG